MILIGDVKITVSLIVSSKLKKCPGLEIYSLLNVNHLLNIHFFSEFPFLLLVYPYCHNHLYPSWYFASPTGLYQFPRSSSKTHLPVFQELTPPSGFRSSQWSPAPRLEHTLQNYLSFSVFILFWIYISSEFLSKSVISR